MSQCSFTFDTIRDSWSEDGKERELVEVRLYEGGPVTFPAYTATEVSLRAALRSSGIQVADVLEILSMQENEEALSRADKRLLAKAIETLNRYAPESAPPPAGHPDSAAPHQDAPPPAGHPSATMLRRRLELAEREFTWEGNHGN